MSAPIPMGINLKSPHHKKEFDLTTFHWTDHPDDVKADYRWLKSRHLDKHSRHYIKGFNNGKEFLPLSKENNVEQLWSEINKNECIFIISFDDELVDLENENTQTRDVENYVLTYDNKKELETVYALKRVFNTCDCEIVQFHFYTNDFNPNNFAWFTKQVYKETSDRERPIAIIGDYNMIGAFMIMDIIMHKIVKGQEAILKSTTLDVIKQDVDYFPDFLTYTILFDCVGFSLKIISNIESV